MKYTRRRILHLNILKFTNQNSFFLLPNINLTTRRPVFKLMFVTLLIIYNAPSENKICKTRHYGMPFHTRVPRVSSFEKAEHVTARRSTHTAQCTNVINVIIKCIQWSRPVRNYSKYSWTSSRRINVTTVTLRVLDTIWHAESTKTVRYARDICRAAKTRAE